MSDSRNIPVAIVVPASAVLGCTCGYIVMGATTSGHFDLGAPGTFATILASSIGVYFGTVLTLTRRPFTALTLSVILGGMVVTLAVTAIFAEIGYCHFNRNGCFNL